MERKGKRQEKPKRLTKKNTVLTDEEKRLFDELIVPNMQDVNNLVAFYSNNIQDFDENKAICLDEMACYIKSFDTSKMSKLRSWIHVCVKNCIKRQDKRRSKMNSLQSGVSLDSYMDSTNDAPVSSCYNITLSSLFDNISDEVYNALMKLPYSDLEPFLLSVQGYTFSEIAKIEYKKGRTKSKSVYDIRCKIENAKYTLKKLLNGYKSEKY